MIRTATLKDLDAIAKVEATCFPVAEAATKEEFKERLEYYGNHFLLLFEEDKLVSFVDGFVTDQKDLTDEMYLLQNFLNIFTICKKINKYQTIGEDDPNSSTDNSGVLVEKYRFAPFFDWSITFIPRYTCFFNSFETEPLPLATKKRYQFNDFKNIYTNISNRNYLRSTALNWANNKKYNFLLNKLSFDCPFDLVYFLHGEV